MAAVCVLFLILIGEVVPPLVVFGLLFAGLAVGARRSPARWVRWLGAAMVVALLALFSSFAVQDLAHPETPASFGPTWLLVVAAVATVVLAVAAVRGGAVRPRTVWVVAGTALVAGIAFTAVQGAGVQADAAQPGDVAVEAVDATYPAHIEVPVGHAVLVRNLDPIRHTFVVDGGVEPHEVPGSTDRRVEIDLPPGEYRYFCDVPGHEAMTGTLIVS
ncbi:MAG TPA: cupredoxin domain-containing protein [Euzebya sp.]|nr:cupredoxin domain-containing protein [Euzebya sp.]